MSWKRKHVHAVLLAVILQSLLSRLPSGLGNRIPGALLNEADNPATEDVNHEMDETSEGTDNPELTSLAPATSTVKKVYYHQPVVLTELDWEIIVAVLFGSMAGSMLLTAIIYCMCGRPEEGHLI